MSRNRQKYQPEDGVELLQEIAETVGEVMPSRRVIERQHGYRKETRGVKSPKAYTKLDGDDVRVFILKGWRVRSARHNIHILPR